MQRDPVNLLGRIGRVLTAGVLLAVIAPAASASAVPHPPPPPGTITTQGVYSMTTRYTGDLNQVRAWQISWTVPGLTNGSSAWGAVGQWFSNLEAGVYYTAHEGWWVYYYGDDNGHAGNNPECFQSWGSGGHCLGAMANLAPGQRVTFVYQYCDANRRFNANGAEICVFVNMNDGVGNRFLAADFPRSEGPEMYAHDIETFADSGIPEPVVSCAQPVRMLGQRVRLNGGGWTNLTGAKWEHRDVSPLYEFRNINLSANPATWQTCSP